MSGESKAAGVAKTCLTHKVCDHRLLFGAALIEGGLGKVLHPRCDFSQPSRRLLRWRQGVFMTDGPDLRTRLRAH